MDDLDNMTRQFQFIVPSWNPPAFNMVYVLDLLLVEYSVFIKCPSLNPLKIDGRARKHARVQNMAPHISCTNTHVILGLTCLYVIHMSVACTYTLPIC